MNQTTKKLIVLAFLLIALILAVYANIGNDKGIDIPFSQSEENESQESSLWGLASRLMSKSVVYKDHFGNFVYEKIDSNLPLDEYDWSDLSLCIKGIDVSKYQGVIDWSLVADDGIAFAMIRLGYRGYTEGKLNIDSCFETNVKGACDVGIPVGVYFLSKALTVEEGIEEADFIIDALSPFSISYPVALDLEPVKSESDRTKDLGAAERTDIYIAILDKIKSAGYTPMIYADINRFMGELDITRLTEYDKWFAQYFNQPYFKYKFTIWQASNTGSVQGIKGNVDIDYAIVDYAND